MGRKQATPEQQAAAAERRQRFYEIAKKIGAMPDEERAALAGKMAGAVMVTGRGLSVHNSCLVYMQRPDATILGGFHQWRKAGRAVRKGERGLMVWAPAGKLDADGDMVAASVDGEGRQRFVPVTVFDVAQTDAAGVTA